jgi:DNA-binding LytR/AlgR family response regulator
VVLTSFVLCAGFLLTGVTFIPPEAPASDQPPEAQQQPADPVVLTSPKQKSAKQTGSSQQQIPYEQDGRTLFIDPASVAAVRAEGHYTFIYTGSEKLFCTWSISEATKRLIGGHFIKCHRSFLINPMHVTSFKRLKDNGVCYFSNTALLDSVPVSRSCLIRVRETLGI